MARLRSEQLPNQLKQGLAPIYLVSGDEPLVVQECCDQIREAAKAAGFAERELLHAEHNFDWGYLYHTSQSLSLFADKKLVEIRLTGKLQDKGRKALVEYAENPAEDLVLLIVAPKFERGTLNAKWFKTLEKSSQFVQVWPINSQQLPRWIKQRAQRMGLSIDGEALTILTSRVEGNLLAATQELEKLKLLTDDGRIDATLMAHAVADSARYDVFTLVDRALHGDARGAVKTLNGLRSEGTEILTVLWALSREIRTLLQLNQSIAQGRSLPAAAKSLGIWESRQPLVKNALSRLKQPQLHRLLRKAAQVDRAVKGMDPADPWAGCLDIVLNIAGVTPLDRQSEKLTLRR